MKPGGEILVVGAGVAGLSSAVELLKAGYRVRIWAREVPPNTTSDKAAAIWFPYLCYPREKALPWSKASFAYFEHAILPDAKSGCMYRTVLKFFARPQPEPWWAMALPTPVERPSKVELPAGYADGYRFRGIVIDTRVYMPYLLDWVRRLGGEIVVKEIGDIREALAACDVAVNCSGLGARELVGDEALYPVRGQMLRVQAKELREVLVDDTGPEQLTLLVPRSADLMLGGTAQAGNWNTQSDPQDSREILRKTARFYPELEEVEVLEEIVGLRPARPEVRVELEERDGKSVVHNYGHGGAGFTLSWGCAQDVLELVRGIGQ